MPWFLYIARFKQGLYTGITKDLHRRIQQHNRGQGAKSLKGKGPVEILYTEEFESHRIAARREIEIKGWRRDKKLRLMKKGFPFDPQSGSQGA